MDTQKSRVSGGHENRFAVRVTKMIAAGALAASMVPLAAYANEPADAAAGVQVAVSAQPAEELAEGQASAAEPAVELASEPAPQADPVEGAVARIGETSYATLDEAVAAAKDGETVEVLADCTTEKGLNLSKDLTIAGVADAAGGVAKRLPPSPSANMA